MIYYWCHLKDKSLNVTNIYAYSYAISIARVNYEQYFFMEFIF